MVATFVRSGYCVLHSFSEGGLKKSESESVPLPVSGLINKPLRSNIPSEYDLLWNVGLSYTFIRQYIEKQ